MQTWSFCCMLHRYDVASGRCRCLCRYLTASNGSSLPGVGMTNYCFELRFKRTSVQK
ncbi:hypothetical protein HanPSC8_Chr10g0429351 [Helianthus annuus]|nr:hypothetical protein HanPSC8_Chr10g0429351 [Helianthus annuus]